MFVYIIICIIVHISPILSYKLTECLFTLLSAVHLISYKPFNLFRPLHFKCKIEVSNYAYTFHRVKPMAASDHNTKIENSELIYILKLIKNIFSFCDMSEKT